MDEFIIRDSPEDWTPASPRYGSVRDIATYSSLSPKTIRNLIDSGDLPARKVGSRVLIAYSDFDSYLRKCPSKLR